MCTRSQILRRLCRGFAALTVGLSTRRYACAEPIECVIQADMLKNQARLKESIIRSVSRCAPLIMQHDAINNLQSTCVPSASTVSSYRLYLDLAFAHYMRSVFTANCRTLTYMWADSSPQAGQQWLMMKFMYIPQSDAKSLLNLAEALAVAVKLNRMISWHRLVNEFEPTSAQ